MLPKTVLSIYLISISIFIISLYLFYNNYNTLADNVKSDLKGDLIFNFIMMVIFYFLIKYPQTANYPIEITNQNKEKAYRIMQYLGALSSLFISLFYCYRVLDNVEMTQYFKWTLLFGVLIPLLVFFIFDYFPQSKINKE